MSTHGAIFLPSLGGWGDGKALIPSDTDIALPDADVAGSAILAGDIEVPGNDHANSGDPSQYVEVTADGGTFDPGARLPRVDDDGEWLAGPADDRAEIISHGSTGELAVAERTARERIAALEPPARETASRLLDELLQFELGRFLLQAKGLNGRWTDYILTHPRRRKGPGLSEDGTALTPLEQRVLERFPTCLATQERHVKFQEVVRGIVERYRGLASPIDEPLPDLVIADILSGVMDVFLSLPRTLLVTLGVKMVGIDRDPESLELVAERARRAGVAQRCQFRNEDAFALSARAEFDLITSNGLIIYVPERDKALALLRQFYKALKAGGTLVISYLTPPPIPGGPPTEWRMGEVDIAAAQEQKILFKDVIDAGWQVYRTLAEMESLLIEAGFTARAYIPDTANIFPTLVATKPK